MDAPEGIVATTDVEGLTLAFTTSNVRARRKADLAWKLLVGFFAGLLLLTALWFVPQLLAEEGPGYKQLWLTARPPLAVLTQLGFGLMVVYAMLRAAVHQTRDARLRLGARGISVERDEGWAKLTAHEDLRIEVSEQQGIPVLLLDDGHTAVTLEIEGDAHTTAWVAEQVRRRCSSTGRASEVPAALHAAREANA